MLGIFSLFIIVVGGLLAIMNPALFVVFYGSTASSTDAYGISRFLSSGFGQYSFVMQLLLIIALLVSVYYNRIIEKKLFALITSYFLICLWIAVVIFQKSLSSDMFYIGTLCIWLEQMSPIYLMILLLNRERVDVRKLFSIYVTVHVILAFLTIYLPLVGVETLNAIKSINYVNDTTQGYDNEIARLNNFTQIFSNKYIFNQLAHFHNSNDTGFFGGVGAVVGILNLFEDKNKENKVFWGIITACSVVLWFNSGMKGPVVGIAAGLLLYLYVKKKKALGVLIGLLVIVALFCIVFSGTDFINTILEGIFNRTTSLGNSIQTRILRREAGIRFILNNPVWGNGASFEGLISNKIDPHELPLRFAVLFGIPAGVLSIVLYYVIPIIAFWQRVHNKSVTAYNCIFLMIFFAVTLTNNYTDIILVQFVLYEACFATDSKNMMRK